MSLQTKTSKVYVRTGRRSVRIFIFLMREAVLWYGKPSLRQIPVLWLVLSRSGFCTTDRFHGNDPIRVFLFWSKVGKFKICNQNSKKKSEYCHSSHWNYQKKLKRLQVFRNFKDGWRRRTFLSASHRKCILLSETECHMINNLLTELARANIPFTALALG